MHYRPAKILRCIGWLGKHYRTGEYCDNKWLCLELRHLYPSDIFLTKPEQQKFFER